MLKLADIKDVIQQWNYECNLSDDIEDQETLDELLEMVKFRIETECGIENPAVRLINKRAQIEVVTDEKS